MNGILGSIFKYLYYEVYKSGWEAIPKGYIIVTEHRKRMISIIGAGPVGNYAAIQLLKRGYCVEIYEEHEKIGQPVQCTGIVTSEIENYVKKKKEFVVNKINKARIHSPNHDYVELRLGNNYILNRHKFDEHLNEIAKEKGAKTFLGREFISASKNKIWLKNKKSSRIVCKNFSCLVGADGPNSTVAKSSGLFGKREFLVGIQARCKLTNDNVIDFYPCIGEYAWIVPENENIVRIGVAANTNVNQLFNWFLKSNASGEKVIERQAGLIPYYNPQLRIQKDNIYIIGDAACQVKATTGGGIMFGLRAAEILADCIKNGLDYNCEVRKSIGKELRLHLTVRNILNGFSESDYNHAINLLAEERIRKLLHDMPREDISKIVLKAALLEPRLLVLAGKHLFGMHSII